MKTTGVCVCGAELVGKAAFTAGRPRENCSAYCRLRIWRLEEKLRRGRVGVALKEKNGSAKLPATVAGMFLFSRF